jgi:pimeloyl-ACP methyl ester carboxylesterase
MNRPMMDPTFVPDMVQAKRRHVPFGQLLKRGGRWFWTWLLSNPLAIRKPGDERVVWPLMKVAIRAAVFWTILLPILLSLVVVLCVYMGTHPSRMPIVAEPSSQGVYFEPANLASTDGTQLAAWLVPAIDARRVVEEKDRTLRLSHPAIVLVHDYGKTMQQMLPLVRPLHDEGIVVLVLGLRGSGTNSLMAAQTFGLNESKDVLAAVDMLRQSAFVDGKRIAVAGVGTGANAALIAAAQDPGIKAVVLADLLPNGDGEVANKLSPSQRWLAWLRPVCRRMFEFECGVDMDELDSGRYASLLNSHHVLRLARQEGITSGDATTVTRIKLFCRAQLGTQALPSLGSAR